jgi:hypothetical protein
MLKVSDGYLTIYTFAFFVFGSIIHFTFFSKSYYNDLSRADRWMRKIYDRVKRIVIIIVFPKEVYNVIIKIIPKKRHFIKIKYKTTRLFKK